MKNKIIDKKLQLKILQFLYVQKIKVMIIWSRKITKRKKWT